MSEQNPDVGSLPEPDHVLPGGVPDPVVATAPRAAPVDHGRDEGVPADDEGLVSVFPATGSMTGAVLPPPIRPRAPEDEPDTPDEHSGDR